MKNNFRKVCALVLAVVMCIGTILPVFASEGGESTVKCPGEGQVHTAENCDATLHETKEAGCGQAGYEIWICNGCDTGTYMQNYVPGSDGCVFEVIAGATEYTVLGNGWYITTAPTCTEKGVATKKCTTHDKTYTEDIAPLGHNFVDYVVDGIDCNADFLIAECENGCGTTNTKPNPDKGTHKWVLVEWFTLDDEGNKTVVEHPLCTMTDLHATFTCSQCGDGETKLVIDRVDLAGAHNYVNIWHENNSASTCGVAGKQYQQCTLCGDVKYVELPTLPHDFTVDVTAVAPTCTTAGVVGGKKCSVCGTGELQEDGTRAGDAIAALGHYLVGAPDLETYYASGVKNCTEDLLGKGTCQRCNTYVEDVVMTPGADEHLNIVEDVQVFPTCTKPGVYVLYCAECAWHDPDSLMYIAPLGHNWGEEPTSEIPATCVTEGKKIYTCQGWTEKEILGNDGTVIGKVTCDCDNAGGAATKEDKILMTGHTEPTESDTAHWIVTPATCVEKGSLVKKCTVCEEVISTTELAIDPLNHPKDKFLGVINPPTCYAEGHQQGVCTACGTDSDNDGVVDTKVDQILPVVPHTLVVATKDSPVPAGYNHAGKYSTDATCTEASVWVVYCSVSGCGHVDLDFVGTIGDKEYTKTAALGHDIDVIATIDPTCTDYQLGTDEYHLVKCANCAAEFYCTDAAKCTEFGYTCTEEHIAFDKNNHDHHSNSESLGTIGGTSCADPEYNAYHCLDCDYNYLVGTGSTAHSAWADYDFTGKVAGTDYQLPTCTVAGWYKCQNVHKGVTCNAKVDLAPLGHKDADGSAATKTEAVAPSCLVPGNVEYWTCALCSKNFDKDPGTDATAKELETVVVDALGHNWGDEIAPTCTTVGGVYCTRCDTVKEGTSVPALGHRPNATTGASIVVAPTCTNDGYTLHFCTREGCQTVLGDAQTTIFYVDGFQAGFHKWDVKPDVASTCTTDGSKGGVWCTVCETIKEGFEPTVVVAHHENAAGVELTRGMGCSDTEHDEAYFTCVHCAKNFRHALRIQNKPATCIADGHYLEYCELCDYEKKVEFESSPDAHETDETVPAYDLTKACGTEWSAYFTCKHCGEKYITEGLVREHSYKVVSSTAAKIGVAGEEIKTCEHCQDMIRTPIAALEGIKFSYTLENAKVASAGFVNGSYVNLTIKYSANNAKVNQIYLNFAFNSGVFKYLGVDFMCTDLFPAADASATADANGNLAINVRADKLSNEYVDVTTTEETVLAVVKFQINPDLYTKEFVADWTKSGLTLVTSADLASAVDYKEINEETEATFTLDLGDVELAAAIITIYGLGDVDNDGVLEAQDLIDLVKYIQNSAASYNVAADINQDGVIDVEDYQLLNRVILLGSYAEMCASTLETKR